VPVDPGSGPDQPGDDPGSLPDYLVQCNESDNGQDFDTKGYVMITGSGKIWDYCDPVHINMLHETYCLEDGSDYATITHTCPYSCFQGACKEKVCPDVFELHSESEFYVGDTISVYIYVYDGQGNEMPRTEFDYFIYKYGSLVAEATAYTNDYGYYFFSRNLESGSEGSYDFSVESRSSGCDRIADSFHFTVRPRKTCSDSDGGREYFIAGETLNEIDTASDSCTGNTLTEYFCSHDTRIEETVECEYGCSGSACVKADCEPNERRLCSANNLGRCGSGIQTCVGGKWTPCPEPTEETCNMIDDNCDGVVDNIHGGTSVVSARCGCYAGAIPIAERLDNIDNDCDGLIDEGCDCAEGEVIPCGTDEGVCQAGQKTCRNCKMSECENQIGPFTEVCGNSKDDDCDGQTDESECIGRSVCHESDSALDYYTKGYVHSDIMGIKWDYCEGARLVEYRCAGTDAVGSTRYNCLYGCSDGACARKPECPLGISLDFNQYEFFTGDTMEVHVSLTGADGSGFPNASFYMKSYFNEMESSSQRLSTNSSGEYVFSYVIKETDNPGQYYYEVFYNKTGCERISAFAEVIVHGASASTCSDSDNGKNYYIKGTTTVRGENSDSVPRTDSCRQSSVVDNYYRSESIAECTGDNCFIEEFYCSEGNQFSAMVLCPEGCKDGACRQTEMTIEGSCYDPDGMDYYQKSVTYYRTEESGGIVGRMDNCCEHCITAPTFSGSYVSEQYCLNGEIMRDTDGFACPYGCENGACLIPPDSDMFCGNGVCEESRIIDQIEEGDMIIAIINGTEYDVTLVEISSNGVAYIKVNTTSNDLSLSGSRKKIVNGLDVYLKGIDYGLSGDLPKTSTLILGENDESCPEDCGTTTQGCTETDQGKDYYTKGSATGFYHGNYVTLDDSCDNNRVQEKYCINNTDNIGYTYFDCSFGCFNGACIGESAGGCYDSDGGKDYYSAGEVLLENGTTLRDVCGDNGTEGYVTEHHCDDETHTEIFKCPEGCEFGACLQQASGKYSIRVARGWNLVSLPGPVNTFDPSSQCEIDDEWAVLFYYSPGNRDINIFEEEVGSDVFEYISKTSFWVYSPDDCELSFSITGENHDIRDLPALYRGWNMVAFTEDMIGKTIGEIENECSIRSSRIWNKGDQSWSSFDKNTVIPETAIGSGWLAYVDHTCDLGTPSRPAFPTGWVVGTGINEGEWY